MKKSIYLSVFLAIVSMISALVLSMTNSLTAETIKQSNIAKQNKKLAVMFNENTKFTEKEKDVNDFIETVFEAEENGNITGYVYSIKTKGYGGKIRFLLGISKDGKYLGFDSLEHNETPGFGTKMDEDPYKGQFKTKAIDENIDGMSGATVTTNGLLKGIEAAKEHYKNNLK